MKKSTIGKVFYLLFLILSICFIGIPTLGASADVDDYVIVDAYEFEITAYHVEMSVEKDRSVSVKEVITAHLSGYDSHGIIRDLPIANGITYSDLNATCDNADFSPYLQTDDSAYLSFYLRGNRVAKGQNRTYTLTYTMHTSKIKDAGYLPLDVIGFDWQCGVENVTVKVTFPDGLLNYIVYSGKAGTQSNTLATVSRMGNSITVSADYLPKQCGITLDMNFEKGVLSAPFDMTILYAVLFGILLLGIAIVLKLLIFRQPQMVTPVNLEAPQKMDPLKMGKLIDHHVDSEDLGAVIFYLADKGYLHIDLTENNKNPTLYKTAKEMSGEEPRYIQEMYYSLFSGRESVRISQLKNTFYRTAEKVIAEVNAENKNLVNQKTVVTSVFFGVLSVLVFGIFALMYSLKRIGQGYLYWVPFVICLVAFAAPYGFVWLMRQRQYKWKRAARLGVVLAGIAIGVLVSLFFMFLMPSAAFSSKTTLLIGLFSVALGTVCGYFICRTKQYTEQLGHILGFKQFITVTEKDKIKFMLQENPELYYHILPYAQVLGVTDEWTDKFKGLDLKPPRYMTYSAFDTAFDIMVWNSLFRSFNAGVARQMVSKPSSSGNGKIGGGFGGGFGGGGFGGGGGRGC